MTISVAYTAADASVLIQIINSSPMRMSDALKISGQFLFRGADVSMGFCRIWSLERDEMFSACVFDSEESVDVGDSDEPSACFTSVTFPEALWFSEVSLFDSTLLIFRSLIMFPSYLYRSMAEETKDPTASQESGKQ